MAILLLAGLACAHAPPAAATAQSKMAVRSHPDDLYAGFIVEAAARYHLPPGWIGAVLCVESGGRRQAISPAGAIGLMQIMRDTWAGLRLRHQLGIDPYDPHDNIMAGAAYIRELLDRYGAPGWIAAYNAGPARYEASLRGRALPQETHAYIVSVLAAITDRGGAAPIKATGFGSLAAGSAPLSCVTAGRGLSVGSFQTRSFDRDAQGADCLRGIFPGTARSSALFVKRNDGRNAP